MTGDPTNFEEVEARLLLRARAGLRPTPADQRRMMGRLSAGFAQLGLTSLSGGERGRLPSARPGEDLPSSAVGYSLKVLAGSVVAAAGLGFGLGISVGGPSAEPPPARETRIQPLKAARETGEATKVDAGEALDLSSLSPEERAPRARSTPSGSSRASDQSPVAPPALYDELSHVRRAQAALKQGNAALALGLMQSLDETEPRGALIAERSVTKVLALCQLGRQEEATRLARAALSQNGEASVYRRRLEASCAKLGPAPTKD